MTIIPLVDTDDTFAFNLGLQYEIVIQKHCICMQLLLLDEIKLHLPRMQCKSDNMALKFWIYFFKNKWPKISFIIELEASKLVSTTLTLCSISCRFYIKKYPVVLAHEATVNLK